jgi:hypothetical protein
LSPLASSASVGSDCLAAAALSCATAVRSTPPGF